MEQLTEQLAVRDRMRKRLAAQSTPAERLEQMLRLQRLAWDLLRQSPKGYAHFLRRNLKARATAVQPEGNTDAPRP
jgi:GAF domain-containing protein